MTTVHETALANINDACLRREQPRTRVQLRAWGFTCSDVAHAEQAARDTPRAAFWEITEVISTVGGACPIPSRDTVALDQGADYDWAWAVHLAGPSDAG